MTDRSRSVLLIDDEPAVLGAVRQVFLRRGWAVTTESNPRTAIEVYERDRPDIVMLDMEMPGLSGLQVLEIIRARDEDATIVMLSGRGDIETAVRALQLGAENFVAKPLRVEHLDAIVELAYEKSVMRRRLRAHSALLNRNANLESLGESPAMREVAEQVTLLAEGNAPILLNGETGTGKGWISRLIHGASPRRAAPFVSVNCAGLSATFLDSELFGHEKGAFTDAKTRKEGLFELANGGTLLLDEIGDLALELQPKLLTVLESKTFRRLGGTREIEVDVRLIAATHVDLAAAVKDGRFREDLYYRIAALPVRIPSLRERGREDIADLSLALLADLRRQLGRGPETISPEALTRIVRYEWPGNVRELRNVLERALLLGARSDRMLPEHLPLDVQREEDAAEPLLDDYSLAASERRHIERVLSLAQGNRARAAKMLGLSRQTLYNRLEEYGITGE
ncbi:MAG: sigma-54-dependent transcriptional regulator [Gemmatimonadaceae bacterium]